MFRNNRLKIVITIVMLIALTGVFLWLNQASSPEEIETNDSIGSIQFRLIDENENIVIDDQINIYQGDTLYTVLDRHYEIVCADRQYRPDPSCSHRFLNGYVILGIEGIDSNWIDTVLSIYVNDSLSNYGVSMIDLEDGDEISIRKKQVDE
jgi:hypothetical protein